MSSSKKYKFQTGGAVSGECPAASLNMQLNVDNRERAISDPNVAYNVTGGTQENACGNCASFDVSQRMGNCMQETQGSTGYCWANEFKCDAAAICNKWKTGGPINDDQVSYDMGARYTEKAAIPLARYGGQLPKARRGYGENQAQKDASFDTFVDDSQNYRRDYTRPNNLSYSSGYNPFLPTMPYTSLYTGMMGGIEPLGTALLTGARIFDAFKNIGEAIRTPRIPEAQYKKWTINNPTDQGVNFSIDAQGNTVFKNYTPPVEETVTETKSDLICKDGTCFSVPDELPEDELPEDELTENEPDPNTQGMNTQRYGGALPQAQYGKSVGYDPYTYTGRMFGRWPRRGSNRSITHNYRDLPYEDDEFSPVIPYQFADQYKTIYDNATETIPSSNYNYGDDDYRTMYDVLTPDDYINYLLEDSDLSTEDIMEEVPDYTDYKTMYDVLPNTQQSVYEPAPDDKYRTIYDEQRNRRAPGPKWRTKTRTTRRQYGGESEWDWWSRRIKKKADKQNALGDEYTGRRDWAKMQEIDENRQPAAVTPGTTLTPEDADWPFDGGNTDDIYNTPSIPLPPDSSYRTVHDKKSVEKSPDVSPYANEGWYIDQQEQLATPAVPAAP